MVASRFRVDEMKSNPSSEAVTELKSSHSESTKYLSEATVHSLSKNPDDPYIASYDAKNEDDRDGPESIGEFLYRLSENKQIEGKKRREAIKRAIQEKAAYEKYGIVPKDNSYTQKMIHEIGESPISNWLYNQSLDMQKSGQKKRQMIEKKLALKNSCPPVPKKCLEFDINGIVTPPKSSNHEQSMIDPDNICERLYSVSKEKIEQGKLRRQSIEAAIKAKKIKPKDYGKVPPSKHDDFYIKNKNFALEKEYRLEKIREDEERAARALRERARQLKEQREYKRRQDEAYKSSTFKYPVYE